MTTVLSSSLKGGTSRNGSSSVSNTVDGNGNGNGNGNDNGNGNGNGNDNEVQDNNEVVEFVTVGRLVEVASRTWPGINKPGGVAKVKVVHFDDDEDKDNYNDNNATTTTTVTATEEEGRKRKSPTHVNVQYMVGGSKEKRVPIEYVKLAPEYEVPSSRTNSASASSLRDRSMLLGRCLKCGSLRTDCGSCDWAIEEEHVSANTNNSTKMTRRSSSRKRKNNKNLRHSEGTPLQDEEDDNDSDDSDDTIELQELVRQAQRRLRKNSKMKKKINNNSHRNYPRILYSSSSSSSSSPPSSTSSSSEMEGSKSVKRNTKRSALSLRTRISKGKSVLESLPSSDKSKVTTTTSSEFTYDPLSIRPKSNTELSISSGSESDVSNSSSPETIPHRSRIRHSKIAHHHPRHSRRKASDDSSESDIDRRSIPLDATTARRIATALQPSYDHQLLALEARARFQMENRQQDGNVAMDVDFIQPEGEQAVENLPEDMLDMSKTVPYPDLGAFYDSMANKIEDETLPDFKLKVAELHRQLRTLKNVGSNNNKSISDSNLSFKRLLEKYNQIWDEVRVSLIQGGTDQCRATLRRLMDDRLYRKHRKKLTPEQRKRCRGGSIMDARNLRMDAMDDTVEAFVRKLKEAVVLCEEECVQNNLSEIGEVDDDDDDDDDNSDIYGETSESSGDDSALDLLPVSEMARVRKNKSTTIDPSERLLSTFNPHSHARLVRKDGTKKHGTYSHMPKSSRDCNASRKKPRINSTTDETNESAFIYDNKNRMKDSGRFAVRIGNNSKRKRNVGSTTSAETSSNAEEIATGDIDEIFENDTAASASNSKNIGMETEKPRSLLQDSHGNPSETTLFESANGGDLRHLNPSHKNVRQKRPSKLKGRSPSNQADLPIRRPSARSISDRMQAFLNANTGNGISMYFKDGEEREQVKYRRKSAGITRHRRNILVSDPKSLSNGSRGRRKRPQGNTQERNEELGDQQEDGGLMIREQETQFTSSKTDALFAQLLTRPPRISGESGGIGVGGDSPENANNLERNIPTSLSEYCNLLCGMELELSKKGYMNSFLHKAYDMLVSRGSRIIQDMVASNDAELSPHIRLLSLCVRSLNFVSNDDLPVIFTERRRDNFLDFLVLQMVDALYSINLPSAWDLKIQDRQRVVRELATLRNALAESIPLVEAVSRCVVQSFGCQQWRKNNQNNHLFVSAVDPSGWRDFLHSGENPESPQVSRYQNLGRVWPRIETDALWRILAFIGAVHSNSAEKSLFRWQIISRLFSSGVLTADDDDIKAKLAPSEAQLFSCQLEIGYFSALMSSGALDSLPTSDSILVKLIQRSLQLQSDSYEFDERSRASCFPSASDGMVVKKTSSMFWRISHPLCLDSENIDFYHVSVSDFPFQHFDDESGMNYKVLLYPSSKLLLSCLSLLVKWIKHIPLKKVRQSRLTKSLKALQDSLLKEAINPSQEPPADKTNISFEDAFSIKPSIEVGIGPERASIFKQEAASYLQIFGSISIHNKFPPELPVAVWKNMSDNDMKKRQIDILDLRNQTHSYTGDAYRLLTAAKVMTTVLFLQMNVSPWHLSLGNRVTQLFVDNTKPGSNCFSFTMSCIFSCLDCLCDLEVGPQVYAQLYEIVVLAFHNLTATIGAGERSLANDHLKSNCVQCFIPVLIRCIKMHLTSSKGWHESYHLRLCLSSVRAIYTFVAAQSLATVPPSTTGTLSTADRCQITVTKDSSNDDDDDMWGDLDDSVLAAYDIEDVTSKRHSKSSVQTHLWEVLSDALQQSKPSKRFAILGGTSTIGSTSTLQMSSIGKFLISKEINEVCDCFSTAIASTEIEGSGLSKLVSKWIHPSYEDDEDSEFSSRAGEKFSSELCLLAAKYPVCQKFVLEHADAMMSTLLKMLMDSSRLEKLPSCNLERIGESTGQSGTKQALLMLDLFNDQSFQDMEDHHGTRLRKQQTKRRESVTGIWNFCHELGTAFAKNDSPHTLSTAIIGGALLNFDSDLLQEFPLLDSTISLENETFKIFRLLRNIITSAVTNDASYVMFERISSCSLMLLANHILRIVQSLKYHDQTCSASSGSNDREYKKARLSELLSSFVELFIASTAWILREGANNTSKPWCFLETYLRDRLISPILKNQSINSALVLQEIIAASKFLLGGPYSQGVSLPTIKCMGLVGCSKYLVGYFFNSIIRRSKQFLVATTALNRKNISLRYAILEAVIGSSNNLEEAVSWKVGTSFPIGKNRLIVNKVMWPYSSPIQKKIDEYLQFVEEKVASRNSNEWWNIVAEMKRSFLIDQLVPKLNSAISINMKRRALRLLSYILEYTNCAPSPNDEVRDSIDIRVVCAIIKAIRSNVHLCLMQLSVDNDIACILFVCSIHLADVVLSVEGEHQNLLSWSRTKILETKEKVVLDLSNLEEQACYVWSFFQWLQTLGNIALCRDDDLTPLRKQWQETQCNRVWDMDDEEILNLEQPKNLDSWDRMLVDFEELLSPSKIKKNQNVVNVYAKSSNTHYQQSILNGELFQPWMPSTAVKRSLKELMAVILSTS